ncbi:MAG: GNAT family N-acetyltransferase [Acidobacteriota bacterium]
MESHQLDDGREASMPLVSPADCELATPPVDPALHALTFPRYRPLLDQASRDTIILVARVPFRSIGLALVTLPPDRSEAKLMSIAVDADYRRRGVATALLTRLADELRALGVPRMHGIFRTGTPSTEAIESLLATCAWSPPRDRLWLFKAHLQSVEGEWLYLDPPKGCRFFPWRELTSSQRQQVEALGLDDIETPFYEEAIVEPANSVGLVRGDDEVVGWMVTHRVMPDMIRYSRLWLHPSLRGQAAGQAVLGRALLWHRDLLADQAVWGVWNVAVDNQAMLKLQEARLSTWLVSAERSRGSVLELGTAPAAHRVG